MFVKGNDQTWKPFWLIYRAAPLSMHLHLQIKMEMYTWQEQCVVSTTFSLNIRVCFNGSKQPERVPIIYSFGGTDRNQGLFLFIWLAYTSLLFFLIILSHCSLSFFLIAVFSFFFITVITVCSFFLSLALFCLSFMSKNREIMLMPIFLILLLQYFYCVDKYL